VKKVSHQDRYEYIAAAAATYTHSRITDLVRIEDSRHRTMTIKGSFYLLAIALIFGIMLSLYDGFSRLTTL
jgi:hypothetical protein